MFLKTRKEQVVGEPEVQLSLETRALRRHSWTTREDKVGSCSSRPKLAKPHTEAGIGGGEQERVETKDVQLASYKHQTQNSPLLSIIIVFHCYYKEKTAIHRPTPLCPKYLKCCCNSKYPLQRICPGRKEYDLEYLIEMCYKR